MFLKTAQVLLTWIFPLKSCSSVCFSSIYQQFYQEKVEIVEVMEEVWEVMEEEEPDLVANNIGRTQKQVFRKKDQKSWDQELQVQN